MCNNIRHTESRSGLFSIITGRSLGMMAAAVLSSVLVLFVALLACIRAYADGTSIVTRMTVYHCHTGSSGGGGGCYSIARTGTRSYEVPCGGTLHYWGDDWGTSECSRCGASYFGDRGGESCPHSETKTESYTYYELGCGHSTSDILGYVTYSVDTTEWAKEVHVTVEIENIGMGLSDTPYVKNGTGYEDGDFTLDENGTYTFSVSADSNSNTGAASYTVTVSNIDHYEPTVVDYTLEPTDWVREGVTLSLDDVRDIQPDGSDGCGLNEFPYSYDHGATWTDDPTHFYENNGDYEVLIRDALDNTATLSFTIDNIDNEAPRILKFEYDHTKNIRTVTVTVECDDVLSDGREGVGLDDLPYSYDGGKTWTDSTSYTVTHNTVIEFRARDRLGNTAILNENITNIDDYAPSVTHYLYPGYWTCGDVEVSFEAKDINPDGSDGIGLPDRCFSYDSGRTWTDEDSITVSENCYVQVAVRDKNDNINYYSLDVTNIDRLAPSITASYTLTNDRRAAILTADGQDGESGIDWNRFDWTGPESGSGCSLIVTSDGTYTVTGYDKAGNSATASVEVSGIRPRLIPIKADINPIPPSDTERVIPDTVSEELPKNITAAKSEKISNLNNTDTPAHKSLWERLSDYWSDLSLLQKILLVTALIMLLTALIALLFLWYKSVAIYNSKGEHRSSDDESDSFTFLGYRLIHTDNGSFTVTVSEETWNKATTTYFRFRLNPLFAFIHKGEQIYISFPEDIIKSDKISHYVDVLVR